MRVPATITRIARQTPTIKSFDLDLGGHELGFKPGQWVDFFVSLEGAEAVGGYSITSSPSVQDSIGLAVKLDEGDHPVTNWLHREARVGDGVEISLGGDFYYTPDMDGPIVLIAGGIGLTPLMSIVRAIDESDRSTPTTLIYSVSTPSEILFRQDLEDIARRNPLFRPVFTITRPEVQEWNGHTGRIDDDMLRSECVNPDSLFFICGPPDMIRDVIGMLVRLGAPGSHIKYEQWW
ncbi:MAG: FAD-dependent oxidoreductase [Dehalococcoidia bacterium]|nr:FAD-dependent oxidoreductase [Dehalococcoidia bacterium]